MENFCGKKTQLLNQRNLILALAIAGVLLFVLSPIVYLQNNASTQDGDKILEIGRDFNPPADITSVKSKTGVIETDKKFFADEDWLKGLTVVVYNNSDKPINYVSIILRFPRPEQQNDKLDFVFRLEYGVNPMWIKQKNLSIVLPSPIPPKENVEIKLSDEEYNALRTALSELKYPTQVNRAKISVVTLGFSDETIWLGGQIFIQDKNEPGKLIPLKKKQNVSNIEAESKGNGCGDIRSETFVDCSNGFNCSVPKYTLWDMGGRHRLENVETICTVPGGYCYPFEYKRTDNIINCTPTPTPTPDCPCGDCVNGCCYPGRVAKSNESSNGDSANSIPEPCGNSCGGLCQQNGGFCDQGGNCVGGSPSPIVIDISGNGFNLTNAANGVLFDIDVDDIREQVSWTTANTDDAWLALDRNQNGTIDSGRELFGNFTSQTTPPQGEEGHGFLALAAYDKPVNGGNGDRQIDFRDSIFAQLKLWQDRNHNGISEQNELQNLSGSPIRIIELRYHESRRTDAHGNQFKYRAKVRDERGAQVGRWAWDVFLVINPLTEQTNRKSGAIAKIEQ